MVGWIPKLIYTQTNVAVAFLLLWIWQVCCKLDSLTIYIPSSFLEFKSGTMDMISLHWPLILFLVELAICAFILNKVSKRASVMSMKAISTDSVSLFDISSLFTILPVAATYFEDKISLSLIYIVIGLLFYEIYAYKRGCSNLTLFFIGYREYSIESSDKMHHRLLSRVKIRKGDSAHQVVEFNDIYLKIDNK